MGAQIFRKLKLLMLLQTLVICSCSMTGEFGRGRIDPEKIIALHHHVTDHGHWETFDVLLDYHYSVNNGWIFISGKGGLSQHYQMIYDNVRQLWLTVYLIDNAGYTVVTETKPILIDKTDEDFNFNYKIKLPAEIKRFSFGYDGAVSEFDSRGYFHFP